MQTQVGASASGAPKKKPHRTSRRLRLMACRVAAQFLGLGAAADNATLPGGKRAGVQFTAPSGELHVANRDLGTVEHVNSSGDLRIRMDSAQEVRFNIREHPHLDYGYAVTSHSSPGPNRGSSADPRGHREKRAVGQQPLRVRIRFAGSTHGAHIYTNDGSCVFRGM